MNTHELVAFGISSQIVEIWQKDEMKLLLPFQENVVRRFGLFGTQNLLIHAPTSAGKTFLGEMAAVHTALHGGRVLYLAPLRAVAEEKYGLFSARYSSHGIRTLISTREHRAHDSALARGEYSIAVMVYEKLTQWVTRRPEQLASVSLVIADELELLRDPDRGGAAEWLLATLLRAGVRVIGLSAVLPEAEAAARWMNAALIREERRPVELRYGVALGGRFRYRAHNTREEGEEDWGESSPPDGASGFEALQTHLRNRAELHGESCLVFARSRQDATLIASRLDETLHLPAASQFLDALRSLPATRSRDALARLASNGMAFHTSDLTPAERNAVEVAFRSGEVRVAVATSTLAAGVNLPAHNVFIQPEKWRYDRRFSMPWKTPLDLGEYENMSGRAGRYGGNVPAGRSILVAGSEFEAESLWRCYIKPQEETLSSQIPLDTLDSLLLRTLSAGFARNESEIRDFFDTTLAGKRDWPANRTPQEVSFHFRSAIQRNEEAGLLRHLPGGGLEITPLGRAIAAHGLSAKSARILEQWCGASELHSWEAPSLVFAAALASDAQPLPVMLSAREYDLAAYHENLKKRVEHCDLRADVPLNRVRNSRIAPFFEEMRAVKTTLILMDWIERADMRAIEEDYQTTAGQILAAAGQIAWIMEAAAEITSAIGAPRSFKEAVLEIASRVRYGLDSDSLGLASACAANLLSREQAIALSESGLNTAAAIRHTHPNGLTEIVGENAVAGLLAWARNHAAPPAPAEPVVSAPVCDPERPTPVLKIDLRQPGIVFIEGEPVRIQEKQYQLMRILARKPGECVPYDEIYDKLWKDVFVEPAQMYAQKRRLLEAIAQRVPSRGEIIVTIPKHGYRLDLSPEEVELRDAESNLSRAVGLMVTA